MFIAQLISVENDFSTSLAALTLRHISCVTKQRKNSCMFRGFQQQKTVVSTNHGEGVLLFKDLWPIFRLIPRGGGFSRLVAQDRQAHML